MDQMSNSLNNHCPRCGFEISRERMNEAIVICNHCGLTRSGEEKKLELKMQRNYVRFSIVFGILLVMSYIHLMQWDQDFVAVIPLKVKSLTGLANAEDYRSLSEICMRRMNYDCAKDSLTQVVQKEIGNSEASFELGELQRKTGDFNSALRSYNSHFERGGQNPGAAFELARLHERKNDLASAQKFYQMALELRPDVLQVTVLQNYVRMLLNTGNYAEADKIITAARKSKGPAGEAFMSAEMNQIKQALGKGA